MTSILSLPLGGLGHRLKKKHMFFGGFSGGFAGRDPAHGVGSGQFQNLAGQVGSGQEVMVM